MLKDWNRGLMVPTRGSVEGEIETACGKAKCVANKEVASRAAIEADFSKAIPLSRTFKDGTDAIKEAEKI
jgi:hypothetical protein